jgi:D-glycero-D-manno-heptose 1,7-bisphosphate phosphatase
MKKGVFLDRDGTLIEDKGYEHKVETMVVYDGVTEGLRLLRKDFLFFIITNQSGIGKGYYTIEEFHKFNNHLINHLRRHGVTLEKTCVCPHTGGCDCRKPKTRFIEELAFEYHIDMKESWVIGDHPSDMRMGISAGCKTAYLLTGHGQKHLKQLSLENIIPTMICKTFLSATVKILDSVN